MQFRLFIAVPVNENIKKKLINNISFPSNFKMTNEKNLHLTLLFLGDTEESLVPELIKKLEDTVSGFSSFDLSIDSTGQFPEKGYPKIIYYTGNEGRDKVLSLAERIRSALKPLGFQDNKPFAYHITIARQKYQSENRIILNSRKFNYLTRVDKVILYRSLLTPNGPVYTELKVIRLTDAQG